MLGRKQIRQAKLFYTSFDLEQRIREDNPLRQIRNLVDFSFVREQVSRLYGSTGKPSIDPIVLMKLMLILFLEQIPSERELIRRLPERLDWLWFCEYDLDSELPNHSVLSKARRRWGLDVFKGFFQRILALCMESSLVDGKVIHIDSSLIDADASKDSLRPHLAVVSQQLYESLDEAVEPSLLESVIEAGTLVSPTDPDARYRRKNNQKVLGYQEHRCVDDSHGIITATVTTDASVHEGEMLAEVMDEHISNTRSTPGTVVADKAYGWADNYKMLGEHNIKPCIPHIKPTSPVQGKYFSRDRFTYDASRDCYICPAGKILKRNTRKPTERNQHLYRSSRKDCKVCSLKSQCTSSPYGKRLYRHAEQDLIDWADSCISVNQRKRLMARRRSVVEGSFADAANNHGYKRARWRRIWRVRIQNLLIAGMQNLRKLLSAVRKKARKVTSMGAFHVHLGISTNFLSLVSILAGAFQIIFHSTGLSARHRM